MDRNQLWEIAGTFTTPDTLPDQLLFIQFAPVHDRDLSQSAIMRTYFNSPIDKSNTESNLATHSKECGNE